MIYAHFIAQLRYTHFFFRCFDWKRPCQLFRCMVAGGVGGCGGMVKEKYGWLHRPKICLRPASNMKYRHCTYLGSFPFCMAALLWQSARVLESMCVCSLPEQNIWQSCPPHPPNLTQAASHLWLLHPTVLLQKDRPEAFWLGCEIGTVKRGWDLNSPLEND